MSSSRKTQYRARVRLNASHSRAMFVLIGPSAQTTVQSRISDLSRLPSSTGRYVVRWVKGPGQPHLSLHTSLSHSARQHI